MKVLLIKAIKIHHIYSFKQSVPIYKHLKQLPLHLLNQSLYLQNILVLKLKTYLLLGWCDTDLDQFIHYVNILVHVPYQLSVQLFNVGYLFNQHDTRVVYFRGL